MNRQEFEQAAHRVAEELGVPKEGLDYFRYHRDRLYLSWRYFRLSTRPLGTVLEVGPYYAFTPFMLRDRAKSYAVLDAPDPFLNPLLPHYGDHDIQCAVADLSDLFGEGESPTYRLPFDDNAFDLLICWEAMEHFNFNPVPFVRDVHRVLKPGGVACITVPNVANGMNRLKLLLGRNVLQPVSSFIRTADYIVGRKKKHLEYHWHEYTLDELVSLFQQLGFEIASAGCLASYEMRPGVSASRRAFRVLASALSAVWPSLGKLCALEAAKPRPLPPA